MRALGRKIRDLSKIRICQYIKRIINLDFKYIFLDSEHSLSIYK